MPYYCTVPRCTSMAGKAKNVSFHQFPRDEELATLWNKILKRGKPYTKYSKVCSLHFTPEDYTITSVGKNKGQWRTLRKDAIPSQNLPSESPTPYQRKQWSSWARDPPPNLMDPNIHQQVAQAIYMQTMLAMQAAGAPDLSTFNHSNGLPPVSNEAFAHTSATLDTDILKGKQTNTHTKSNSFKCTECSKCFKDPDVFILHKRSHMKNEKNEKENFNLNLTLQANPILANLLKTNTENSNIFDTNISVESLLMTALAANMEGYMRNFTSMVKGEERGHSDHDRGHSNHEKGHSDHDNGHTYHERHSDHDRGHLDHRNGHIDHDTHDGGSYDQNNDRRGLVQDCQSTSQSVSNYDRSHNDRGAMNYDESDINNDRDLMNRDRNVFKDRIIEHYRNNTYDSNRSVRYYENDSGSTKSDEKVRGMVDHDRGTMDHDRSIMSDDGEDHMIDNDGRSVMDCKRRMIDHDSGVTDSGRPIMDCGSMIDDDRYNGDGVTNDDSQGSSDEPICDNDLNESIDSNSLVIDETI